MVPIESEEEYKAFLMFLSNGKGKVRILLGNKMEEKSSQTDVVAASGTPNKSMKSSEDEMAALLDEFSAMTLPAPIQPVKLHTVPSSSEKLETMSKTKKKAVKSKPCEVTSTATEPRRASARFVAEVESNFNDAILKKIEENYNRPVNAKPKKDKAPEWLKQYLAEFRENLMEEVNGIVQKNGGENNAEAKANESPEKEEVEDEESFEEVVVPETTVKHQKCGENSLLQKLADIEQRESDAHSRVIKIKMKKLKLVEKVNNKWALMARKDGVKLLKPLYVREPNAMMDVEGLGEERPIRLKPGQCFVKEWRFKNVGQLAWNDNTVFSVVFIDYELDPRELVIPYPHLKPQQEGSVSVNFSGISRAGVYQSMWSFFDKEERFGPMFVCDVIVEPIFEGNRTILEKRLQDIVKQKQQQQQQQQPSNVALSDSDSDNEDNDNDSIAIIDEEKNTDDDDAGFVVVPMPPCFFPDKPQDSTVNVVVKTGKKSDVSPVNEKAQADGGIKELVGEPENKMHLNKISSEKCSPEAQRTNGDAANVAGAAGYSQAKHIDTSLLERPIANANPVQEGETSPESDKKMKMNMGKGDSKENGTSVDWHQLSGLDFDTLMRFHEMKVIKLFQEQRDAEGWEKFKELKLMKMYEEASRPPPPSQYQMVPEMAGHNFGLPQHSFNPVQARYPVPPMPFQAGFVNPPIIPRNIVVPPPPAVMFPPPPPPPLPSAIPLDLANSIYLQPSPYGQPLSEEESRNLELAQNMSAKFGKYYTMKGAAVPHCCFQGPCYKKPPCMTPKNVSMKAAVDAASAAEAEARRLLMSIHEPNVGGKVKPKAGSLSQMLVDKKLGAKPKLAKKSAVETTGKIEINKVKRVVPVCKVKGPIVGPPACAIKKPVVGPTASAIKEPVVGLPACAMKEPVVGAVGCEMKEQVAPPLEEKKSEVKDAESSGGAEPSAVEQVAAEFLLTNQLPENQPCVDILPEALVNGVISAVNTASSACASALNTLSHTRKQVALQTDKLVYDDPKFEESIAQLYEMGFYNYEKNCRLLKQYNFVVEDVVTHYITHPNEL
ncbi:uncharacterized protein LOC111052661 [Nilaparvata lugens]|uniref:uncharacterized protein LOC111052661 n=1 Tax=Nilaparvata lugens TaxID=108931 RepID=UPI00193E2787|nr:uncharacterized protein LOC111052661 [Nilaparvata lugens]